jgi:hypothetical protein
MSRTYKKWTQADIQFILDNHDMLDKDVAFKLSQASGQNITPSMVRRQRRKSGVAKKRGRPPKAKTTTMVSG